MEAGKRRVLELSSKGRVLEIPFFQRNHVWSIFSEYADVADWNESKIEERTAMLADKSLGIWPGI